MIICPWCELTLNLQMYMGADEKSNNVLEKCLGEGCHIKRWKQPMKPVEIIVHYKYGFFRDEVLKDKKIIKTREGMK